MSDDSFEWAYAKSAGTTFPAGHRITLMHCKNIYDTTISATIPYIFAVTLNDAT